jgi:hypothetical protein
VQINAAPSTLVNDSRLALGKPMPDQFCKREVSAQNGLVDGFLENKNECKAAGSRNFSR